MGLLTKLFSGDDEEEEKPEDVESTGPTPEERAESQRKALENLRTQAAERSQAILDDAEQRGELTQRRAQGAAAGEPPMIGLDEVHISASPNDPVENDPDDWDIVGANTPAVSPDAPVPTWGPPTPEMHGRMANVNALLRSRGSADPAGPAAPAVDVPSFDLEPMQITASPTEDPGPAPTPAADPRRAALQSMQGGGATAPGNSGPVQPPAPGTEGVGVGNTGPQSPAGQALPGTRLPALQQQADEQQGYAPNPDKFAPPEEAGTDPLVRGRRVDRALSVVQAIMRLAGGVGGAVGAATGNPAAQAAGAAISGLGGVAGAARGYGREAAQDRAFEQRDSAQAFQQNRALQQDSRSAEDRAASRALQERRVGTMEAREDRLANQEDELAPFRAAVLEAQAERMRTQTQGAEYETATDREMRDPTSDVSRRAQTLLRRSAAALGRNFTLSDEEIAGMSAADLEPFVGRYGSVPRAFGRRDGGGGGRGGGVSRTVQAMPERFVEAQGGDQDVAVARWRDMTRSQRADWYAQADGSGEGGSEIVSGVRSEMELSDSEVRNLREGLASMQRYRNTLRNIGQIAERHGGLEARISADARAEVEPNLVLLRGMVATLGQTGTINEGEVPRINAALPNPQDLDQMTFGTFGRRLQTWQGLVTDSARASLRARSVPEEGIDRALRVMNEGIPAGASRSSGASGASGASRGATSYRVTVNGRTITTALTDAERATAERRGATVEAAP